MESTGNEVAVISNEQAIQEIPSTKLTKMAIAGISEQMALAEELVNKLLNFGIDYGVTPGTQSPGLWDAGASKIIRAFRCHATHNVLFREESDDLVSWTIEVNLVNEAGEIVGTGLGNASTRETKYKYRWVEKKDALREGYTEMDIAELKSKPSPYKNDVMVYRINNPEYGELAHTLLTMASKRAEVDAAKSLPGVGSALRAKFDAKPGKAPATPAQSDDITLAIFWSILKASNVSEDNAHKILKVKSMNDWLASGKLLRDALSIILKTAVQAAHDSAVKKQAVTKEQEPAPAPATTKTPQDMTKTDVYDIFSLISTAHRFYDMTEPEIFAALGYLNRQNFIEAGVQTPWEAWLALVEMKSA